MYNTQRNRKINKEDLLVNETINTIVTSKKRRAEDFLQRLKQDQLYAHNLNSNFDQDFVDVINLSAASALHCNYQYMDVVINFAFPLFKNQYALYQVNNKTVGYLSWAWFSTETEQQFFGSDRVICNPDIVTSGSVAWVIDVIAPFGHVKSTVKHATAIAHSRGVAPGSFKFQRNYTAKSSRKNFWQHR
jgi:hemolysin-activating ACP:hemolysin acyltransferase